jgi:hypothetical protein
MTILVRVAFLIPALMMASSVSAEGPISSSANVSEESHEIRYVTLDRMIRTFAEEARAQTER